MAETHAFKDITLKLFEWSEADQWNQKLAKLEPAKRCETFALAYAMSIWKLSTTQPELAITGPWDIQVDEKSDSAEVLASIARDRIRAAWYMRYVHFTAASILPRECRSMKVESEMRWNYLFADHRAFGLALGMCGRPMSAHYIDEEVINHVRQAPAGWDRH